MRSGRSTLGTTVDQKLRYDGVDCSWAVLVTNPGAALGGTPPSLGHPGLHLCVI